MKYYFWLWLSIAMLAALGGCQTDDDDSGSNSDPAKDDDDNDSSPVDDDIDDDNDDATPPDDDSPPADDDTSPDDDTTVETWLTEIVVENVGNFNNALDYTMDSQDQLHLVYFDKNDQLFRSVRENGEWNSEIITTIAVGLGPYLQIKTDNNGYEHIVILTEIEEPQYCTNQSDEWFCEAIPMESAWKSAYELDANDKPIIVTSDSANRWWLIRKTEDQWIKVETNNIDNSYLVGPMYMEESTPKFVKLGGHDNRINYAEYGESQWTEIVVKDFDEDVLGPFKMAYNSNGIPHFAYNDMEMADTIYYLSPIDGGWQKEFVTWFAFLAGIFFNQNDVPYISYDGSEKMFYYAFRNDNDEWQNHTVLAEYTVYPYKMVFKSNDKIWVCNTINYYDGVFCMTNSNII